MQEEGLSRRILGSRGDRSLWLLWDGRFERVPELGRVCVGRAVRALCLDGMSASYRKLLVSMTASVGTGVGVGTEGHLVPLTLRLGATGHSQQ